MKPVSPFDQEPRGIKEQVEIELGKIPEDDRDDLADIPALPESHFMARHTIRKIVNELVKELSSLPVASKQRAQIRRELQGYRKDLRRLGKGILDSKGVKTT